MKKYKINTELYDLVSYERFQLSPNLYESYREYPVWSKLVSNPGSTIYFFKCIGDLNYCIKRTIEK